MKNGVKTWLFGFFIGAVIFSSIGVVAYSLSAKDISFTPNNSNWQVDNINDAINDLYKNSTGIKYDGKNPNLYFYNGADVKTDDNGDKYLSFDGIDDYVKLDTLPASINWEGGFTVEFNAQWDAFNPWSRIFEFGNGEISDNIGFENSNNTGKLILYIFNGTNSINPTTTKSLTTGIIYNIKASYLKNDNGTFDIKYLVNDELFYTTTTSMKVKNIERLNNYLGNFPYKSNRAFKGRIYNLKINQADGVNIINIDVNKMFNK